VFVAVKRVEHALRTSGGAPRIAARRDPQAGPPRTAIMRPWASRNVTVARVVGPLLIGTGSLAFVLPPGARLMSAAAPYNVFHIVAGAVALAIAVGGRPAAAATFNLGFGLLDLYQAVAGLTGLPPAAVFTLRPADHVVHVALGLPLAVVGWLGLRRAQNMRPSERSLGQIP
jgi:hypothetical protein